MIICKRKISNLVSILLILTLLPATSGVSVFHHICNAKGTHSVSIYTAKYHHQEVEQTDCEHCTNNINTCSYDNHTDCIAFVEFISIETDFLSSAKMLVQPHESILLNSVRHFEINNVNKDKNTLKEYFKQDIKKPVFSYISFITCKSQNKTSEKPSDSFIA